MSFKAFLDESKKGLPSPAYLLSSSDPFLHSEALVLVRELVPAHERDFNFHDFDLTNLGDLTFDQVLDVLNTIPFFSGRKVVVLGNLQKVLKKDIRKLGTYLEKPSETTLLILLCQGTVKKETRDALGKIKSITLDITEGEIVSWLKTRAGAKGITLSDSAAEYLLGTVGPDLGLLSSELEKCALIGPKKIEKEDILEIVDGRRTLNAFALVDAIRARDAELAMKISRILRDTEEPYSLLGALNWQYAKSFTGEASTSREYSYELFRNLNNADIEIKSSGGPYPIEFLIIKLLRLSKAR